MLARRASKAALGLLRFVDRSPARGATILTYHRVGGGSGDELDLDPGVFAGQLDLLLRCGVEVVALDTALDRLADGDDRPTVVLTFDDGFADVRDIAFPLLLERGLPFTLYLAAGLVGGTMAWEGSAAASQGAHALTWDQVAAMHASGLCTVGNHTFKHVAPEHLTIDELELCSAAIEGALGKRPAHLAWTWGISVPRMLPDVRARFRSAATGAVGRNLPGDDLHALRRIPVRASDPPGFFAAKLQGRLFPERAYAGLVPRAKWVASRGR